MGFVYLLMMSTEVGESHKIGITKNSVSKRVKSLQTGNPNPISILQVYESQNYKLVEKWLHGQFNMSKTLANNEWFQLTNDQVRDFLGYAKKGDDIVSLMLRDNPFFKS